MAFFRKIKAGLVKSEIEEYVGEQGQLFFNVETGELRLGDDVTPGGISVGGSGEGGSYTLPTASTAVKGGVKIDGTTISIENQVISVGTIPYNKLSGTPLLSAVATSGSYTDLTNKPILFSGSYTDLTNKPTIPSMTVSLIDSSNTVTNPLTNITAIRFDTDSGFDITDLGSGAVKVGMNSTFKYWKVAGQDDLVAIGLDTIQLIAGSGLAITTNPLSDPKSITFKAIDKTVTLYQEGSLTPTIGSTRWYNPRNVNINTITARLSETSSSSITVRIKKSETIVSTINFTADQSKITESVDIDMIEDDYLTVDVLTSGGQGLSVQFTYSFN
jgi:hypothetical protein